MKRISCCIQEVYKSVFFVLGIFISLPLYSQFSNGIDYREVFGDKYVEAATYLSQSWIADSLKSENIDPCFAKAIVFPELIRYSSLRDQMEVHGLITLYIQFGKSYANFSVGHFQMKPGFAELIEKDAYALIPLSKELLNTDTADNPKARLARIRRLDNPVWQLKYLVWFIKIAENRFAKIQWKTPADKLKFYAAAYNCGYNRPKNYILKMIQENYYHTSLFKGNVCYNYADISLSYYNNCK